MQSFKLFFRIVLFTFLVTLVGYAQKTPPPEPFGPLPSNRQTQWHDTEFYSFIHFTINTFTDKEWGFGDESPELFNPTAFDPEQIVLACKNAGMKGLILTTKHHDGFCLWPTKTTEHNISKSPYKGGKGDIVGEIIEQCRKHGLKVGIYLSPWDRNSAAYGTPGYIEIFRAQLKELLTNYGDIFEVWFDGANGGTGYYGGANEKREIDRITYYDWENTWKMIRELQPNATIFSDIGPDVRWIGNEQGYAGDPCWHRYTPKGRKEGDPPGNGLSKYWESVNGHREGKYWLPAETNTSIRPGWFYHASEDDKVKSPERLVRLYYESIGRGTTLILNLPPNRRGIIHANDIKSLTEFKKIIDETFDVDLAQEAIIVASNTRGKSKTFDVVNLLDDDKKTYWATDDRVQTANIIVEFPEDRFFNVINIEENIQLGQKIWGWSLDKWYDGNWVEIGKGESIGHRRLWKGGLHKSKKVRLRITEAAGSPALTKFSIHKEPYRLKEPSIIKNTNHEIEIRSNGTVYYTLDGSEPSKNAAVFQIPFQLPKGGVVKAKVFYEGKVSRTAIAHFGYQKKNWSIVKKDVKNDTVQTFKNAIDENKNTYWVAKNQQSKELIVDLNKVINISSFTMTPRMDGNKNGLVSHYEFYLSNDGKSWDLVSKGEFSNIYNNTIKQDVKLNKTYKAKYFKFIAIKLAEGKDLVIAEIGVSKK